MAKSAVRVAVRTRPTDNFASELDITSDKKVVNVHIKPNEKAGFVNNAQQNWTFKYDYVFHNASQETVFEECARDIVQSAIDGYNGTILAYGQTGAGKTFTMTGGNSYKYRGIAPRAISHIFRYIQSRPEVALSVRISYVEIYNEQLCDLLSADSSELQIVDDSRGNVVIKGLSKQVANNEEEALNCLFEGETNRAIGEHQLNRSSTRSHCIFTLYLESKSRVDSGDKLVTSKLNIVDLAGSERLNKTGSDGTIAKEANYINKSLTFLEQVVIALADKQREHVPYRQSKLTNILRDSLGGNCKTLMIANLWPESSHMEEIISTLKFASRMMRVKNDAVVNEQTDPLALIKKYEREIRELKQELAMHDAVANRGRVQYEPYTEEQRIELNTVVRRFLAGDIDDIEIVNVRQIKEVFNQFKLVVNNKDAEVEERLKQLYVNHKSSPRTPPHTQTGKKTPGGGVDDDGVGELDASGGFSIGQAPTNARPTTTSTVAGKAGVAGSVSALGTGAGGNLDAASRLKGGKTPAAMSVAGEARSSVAMNNNELGAGGLGAGVTGAAGGGEGGGDSAGKVPPLDKNAAYDMFKSGGGAEINGALEQSKGSLKEKKKALKDVAQRVNDTKRDIDHLRDNINQKKRERQMNGGSREEEEEVIDEEEYNFIRQLKDEKRKYHQLLEEYKAMGADVQYTERVVEQAKEKLIAEFHTWYSASYGSMAQGGKQDVEEGKHQQQATSPTQTFHAATHEEILDETEQFEQMEMEKILQTDPDSAAYYRSRKNVIGRSKLATGARKRGILRRL